MPIAIKPTSIPYRSQSQTVDYRKTDLYRSGFLAGRQDGIIAAWLGEDDE